MSRIGNKVIHVPASVTVTVGNDNHVTVKGPKGQIEETFNALLDIKVEGQEIKISRPNNDMFTRKSMVQLELY